LAVVVPFTALVVFAVGCGKKDTSSTDTATAAPSTAATPAPAPANTALRVTDVELGRHIGTDKHVSDRTDAFGVRDTIYASVVTDGAAPNATLAARWTYQNGQRVAEKTQAITPTGGTTATEFHIVKPSPWPKGTYTVHVLLNGSEAQTKTFTVK
jgi:hypothetical protein